MEGAVRVLTEVGVDERVRLGELVSEEEEEVTEGLVGEEREDGLFRAEAEVGAVPGQEDVWIGGELLELVGSEVGDWEWTSGHVSTAVEVAAFIVERGCFLWCFFTISGAWTFSAGSQVLSLMGYPFHLIRYCSFFRGP